MMPHPLIGIHAILGEIGVFAFLWVFVELLNPTQNRIKRARTASLIGVICFFLTWIIGGYYYLTYYGSNIKPLIKQGPQPWAHTIIMEAKEHIFLFLPFLGILCYFLLRTTQSNDQRRIKSILRLTGLIVIIGFLMALMGYLISTGFRSTLEAIQVT